MRWHDYANRARIEVPQPIRAAQHPAGCLRGGLSAKCLVTAGWTLKHFLGVFRDKGLDGLNAGTLDRWMESRSTLSLHEAREHLTP